MALQEECLQQGNWLFRWRGQLPFLLLPVFVLAIRETAFHTGPASGFPGSFFQAICLGISFGGLLVRAVVVGFAPPGTSGRNTRQQVAETLNTTGFYSLCRHPLYLGNFLILLGMVLFTAQWWAVLITILAFWLYYERIMLAEEEFLRKKFGQQFLAWAETTPAFLPRWRRWQPPRRAFDLRKVLAQEYTSLLVIAFSFTLLRLLHNWFLWHRWELSLPWKIFFLSGVGLYILLRTLRKKTRLLQPREA